MAGRVSEKEKREREKAAELRRKNYKSPAWTSDRPKPHFDPTVWTDPETVDVLSSYTDWHGRHAHMVTPRTYGSVLVLTGKDIQVASPRTQAMTYTSEEDKESIAEKGVPLQSGAQLVSYGNGMSQPALSPEYLPTRIGQRGKFAQVNKVANKFEREAILAARYDSEDTWYKMSVKDGLETYHTDGDHTSVKLQKPRERPKSLSTLQFEAEAKWKAEQYAKYQGGGPNMSAEQVAILEALMVNQTTRDVKAAVSPWADTYEWTDFNKTGTLLDDFNKADQDRRIAFALECHEELIKNDEARKIAAKKARIAEKRKLLGLSTPQTPGAATAGLSGFSRPGTGQVHPMETVAEGDDLVVQDLDEQTYDGGNSVSSMGGMTYQDLDGHAGQSLQGSIDGGDSQLGGRSLTSGSTYLHKTHGDDMSAIDISSGASQQARQRVSEATLQAALIAAGPPHKHDNDEVSVMTGVSSKGAKSKGGSLGGTTVEDSSSLHGEGDGDGDASWGMAPNVDTKSTKKSKKQKKLEGILKGKGIGPASSSQSGVASMDSSAGRSLVTKVLGAPLRVMVAGYRKIRGNRLTIAEQTEQEEKLQENRKTRDADVVLSDEEDGVKPGEDELLDKYDIMTKKLGGADVLEAQAEEWQKFAALVRKQSKRDTNMFDSSMDLPDAIEKCNLTKVVFLLAVGQNDPNMRANNDEPVLINLLAKIIAQDALTGSLADDKDETPERVKLFRVLQALVKFNVTINTTAAKNGVPPLHMAVAAGNVKLVNYLLECGADINLLSMPPAGDATGTTVLMQAAKFGYIEVIADLIRRGADMQVQDDQGRNVLHYAAMFGQTRASLFLLRCGHDKRTKDKNKHTAGSLADELGFTVTAQAIMTFAVIGYQAQFALEYFTEKARLAALPKGALGDISAAASAAFSNASAALGNAAQASKDAIKNLGSFVLKALGCVSSKVEKVNADDAFSMVQEMDDNNGNVSYEADDD